MSQFDVEAALRRHLAIPQTRDRRYRIKLTHYPRNGYWIPAKAGTQSIDGAFPKLCRVDSRFRGNDRRLNKLKERYEAGVNSEKRKWAHHAQFRDVAYTASLHRTALLFRCRRALLFRRGSALLFRSRGALLFRRLGGGKRFPTPR